MDRNQQKLNRKFKKAMAEVNRLEGRVGNSRLPEHHNNLTMKDVARARTTRDEKRLQFGRKSK